MTNLDAVLGSTWDAMDQLGRDDLTDSPNQYWSAPAAAYVPQVFLEATDANGLTYRLSPEAVPFLRARALDRWRADYNQARRERDKDLARDRYNAWATVMGPRVDPLDPLVAP